MSRDPYNIRGPGWRADCPNCVGSKFTCDEHYVWSGAVSGRWDENGKLHLRERDENGRLK